MSVNIIVNIYLMSIFLTSEGCLRVITLRNGLYDDTRLNIDSSCCNHYCKYSYLKINVTITVSIIPFYGVN